MNSAVLGFSRLNLVMGRPISETMPQSLAKYHQRFPRYILNTDDDSLIRLAGPRQEPWEEGTEIQNVSLTGLAFTAPQDLCPSLGEVIKVQFRVPGSESMASLALVSRLERKNAHVTNVAVHFYKMELSQRVFLAQSLLNKMNAKKGAMNVTNLWKLSFSLSLALLLTFFWSALLYFAFFYPFEMWFR